MDVATIVRHEKANAQRPTLNAQLAEVRLKAGVEIDPCAPAHLKLAPSPTRSLLPSQFYLLCRFSQKLHSTSRCAHLCRSRPCGSIRSLATLFEKCGPRTTEERAQLLRNLITRTSPCLRQLPSCIAVYPRDSRSRCVLCRSLRSRRVVSSRLILLVATSTTNCSQSLAGNFLFGRRPFSSRKTRHAARAVRLLPSRNG